MEFISKVELLLQAIFGKEPEKINVIETYIGTKTLKELFMSLVLSDITK